MKFSIPAEVATATLSTVLMTPLGYFDQNKWMKAIIATLASGLCLGGSLPGCKLAGNAGVWLGLTAGMMLAGTTVPWRLGKLIRGRSGRFIAGFWVGHCTLRALSY